MVGRTVTPRDLLERLGEKGINLSVKLRIEGDEPPPPETLRLLESHRNDLIRYLTQDFGDTPQMCRLSEQLVEGALWCRLCYRYQLRPCKPSEKCFHQPN